MTVRAGTTHSIALDITGEFVYAWGRCQDAELGQGFAFKDRQFSVTPVVVKFPQVDWTSVPVKRIFRDIQAGGSVSMAITTDNECFTWGFGENGATGHAVSDDQDIYWPRQLKMEDAVSPRVPEGTALEIMSASVGHTHSMVLVKEVKGKRELPEP